MNAEELVGRWMRSRLHAPGYDMHEKKYGCKITLSNMKVGIEGDGCCEVCYSESAVIFYDLTCSCPAQVPSKKNPEKMMKNKQRFDFKNMSISAYDLDLVAFVDEILELNKGDK